MNSRTEIRPTVGRKSSLIVFKWFHESRKRTNDVRETNRNVCLTFVIFVDKLDIILVTEDKQKEEFADDDFNLFV